MKNEKFKEIKRTSTYIPNFINIGVVCYTVHIHINTHTPTHTATKTIFPYLGDPKMDISTDNFTTQAGIHTAQSKTFYLGSGSIKTDIYFH